MEKKSINKYFSFLFIFLSVLSLLLFFTGIRNILILAAEHVLGRSIEHPKWHSRMIRLEFWFFIFSFFIGFTLNNVKMQNLLRDRLYRPFSSFIKSINFDSNSQKSFGLLFLLYLLGFSSIIRANFFYVDDYRRNAFGVRSWDRYGRYIDDILSPIVHGSKYLCDASPLTHILSALILAYSSFLVIKILKNDDKKKITFLNLFAIMPLGINPYFLENISYRFDCPYMSLSILASIVPFCFYKSGLALYSLVSIIGILVTDMTYQASSGIYPIITVLLCWKLWNKGEKFSKFLLVSIFSYLIGMLIFKIFLMHPSPETYNSNKIMLSRLIPNFKE
nr:glucosyltransferase domain-containing protein [Treponema sp.]